MIFAANVLRRVTLAIAVSGAVMIGAPKAEDNLQGAPVLSEARWLAPGANAVAALSESPGECLRRPEDDSERYLIEVGRAAFRTPLLLGGPAARNGLSCNSCHRDGRGNADFFLEGLSGNPGTADVTSSLFSKSRDDDAFNPVVIPSLVGVGARQRFGTVAPQASLHAFIDLAVGEEFQGAPPPQAVRDGLALYVARLDEGACPDEPRRESARRAIRDVTRALGTAMEALSRGDVASGDFLFLAAQRALLPVHERFAGADLKDERAAIESLGRDIGALRPLVPRQALGAASLIKARAHRLGEDLHKRRKKSLYDLQVLQRAVEEAQPDGD